MKGPNKDLKFPIESIDRLCFLKNIIKNPNIIVGDYTYYDDFENVVNFEKNVKWWDWDIEKITKNVQHLTGLDIEKLENWDPPVGRIEI